MNTCDTCEYWDAPEEKPQGTRCHYGVCGCEKMDCCGYEKSPDLSGCQPSASDDWGIHLKTGPKFGCIHWQKKE